ncbi:MAG: hypothetical protein H2069_05790 [Legionella sp.]|nr:hypothetical protein [Legionella sp.]
MHLNLVMVNQGNGQGQSIHRGSQQILQTEELVGCIAVLIVGKNKVSMIHSDSNWALGKGAVSFVDGIKLLGLEPAEKYLIGLIGGSSVESLKLKYDELKKSATSRKPPSHLP